MEWLSNPLIMVGIGIGVMFFGYFFGLFEGRGQGYKKRQKEEAEQGRHEPLPPASPPVTLQPPPSLLRLSQDGSQRLQLELDGEQVNTSALTVDQRRRLIDLLTLIRPWLEGKPASPTPAESRARPTAPPPVDRLSTPPSASTDRPIPSSVSSGSSKTTKEEPAAPLSMIGQIDAILQEKLAGSSLAGKNIRLKDSPGGGVTVFVGINRYAGLDEVPDEEIKAIIRASIAEWENKFTPGL